MDLSFTRFDKAVSLGHLSPDLAVLMVTIAARQAASPTAAVAARSARAPFDSTLFAPRDGAFNGAVADLLVKWKDE